MKKKINFKKKEQETLVRLNNLMGLDIPEEKLSKRKAVKQILLNAWEEPDEKLHDWGMPRKRISALVSKLSGFNHYVLKRTGSIYNVLL